MIHAITFLAYPDHPCAQVVALGMSFHDQYRGGPVSFLAFDRPKGDLVKIFGLFVDNDQDHPLVLRFPQHRYGDFDGMRERVEANGMLERVE